ncbi:FAD-binding oxidoreductase [Silicimonas sp. MF1-12-2]|uniref:FAD-binding oxidoreductase n=1 Tax=Silicimonas sp. MF1-12-2 TaxID=3384793 RepID=UPI0039B41216
MADFSPPEAAVLDRLKAIVGDGGWREAGDAERYFEDPRGRFKGQARLVLLPGSTEEVSRIVRLCYESRTGLIPYGGGTGVVAGQLSPEDGNAIILSVERLNRIREVNAQDFAMVVEAGCILENIHAAASEHGLMFPLSMASKGSCTIGGNLATNAGGIQVVRYGNARDLCLGIEAVLPSGDVLSELNPLRKNNTGYDLRHLLIGSEGTLGIITAATIVLKPMDPETVTAFCALSSPAQALRVFEALRKSLGESLSGLELMSDFGLGLVNAHFPDLKNPLAEPDDWYLLAEASGLEGMRERVETALADCMEAGLIGDAVVAASEAQRAKLWDLRENTPEANRLSGAICNSDTAVPISRIGDFVAATHAAVKTVHPGLRTNSYGHIGDGNIHHNVFPPEGVAKPDFIAANPGIIDAVRHAIDDVTVQCNGSISAEHGIGRLKTGDLAFYASKAKLQAIRQIKAALDPHNIMNPGAIVAE